MKTLRITSNTEDYYVEFTEKIYNVFRQLSRKHTAHFLIDSIVFETYKKLFTGSLDRASVYSFKATEERKNLQEVYRYANFLLSKKIQKNHTIIVVGGGVVQDIGSFTSHILFRGIDWIFIPTTLLTIADSCIGSKSGINIGRYKNQLGAFHHPSKIYIDSSFLHTLPQNELINGKGEIIKHAVIKGEPAFSYIMNNLDSIGRNKKITDAIIQKSLLIKKEIIEEDEYEKKGIRKLLNYGHTFGHALEGYSKNKISHGIAVLNGMDMANFISLKRNFLSQNECKYLHACIKKYIPYKKNPIKNIDKYMSFLAYDKKAIGNSIQVIVCKEIGHTMSIKIKLDKRFITEIVEYQQFF